MTLKHNLIDLLAISITGSISDQTKLYQRLGLKANVSTTLRNALAQIKRNRPPIIIAEFVYGPTYGSQLSNFESILAAIQTYAPDSKIIALVYPDDIKHCEKVISGSKKCLVLTLPVNENALEKQLTDMINQLEEK